jgi:hypothetical protein
LSFYAEVCQESGHSIEDCMHRDPWD